MSTEAPPNILYVIRMYRAERGWDFPVALVEAVNKYDERGWPVPDSIRVLFKRHSKETDNA